MPTCAVIGCKNRSTPKYKKKGLAFHILPKDEKLKHLWLVAIGRENWTPSKYACVCSDHFSKDLYDKSYKTKVRLRENAVPNIVEACASYSQKDGKRRAMKYGIFLNSNSAFMESFSDMKVHADNPAEKPHFSKKIHEKPCEKSIHKNIVPYILQIVKVEPHSEEDCYDKTHEENDSEYILPDDIDELKFGQSRNENYSYQGKNGASNHVDTLKLEHSNSVKEFCRGYAQNKSKVSGL